MSEGMKIRVCNLKENDIYVKLGIEYKVVKIKDGKCYYRPTSTKRTTLANNTYMGANSQELVMLVGEAPPSKKIPYKSRLIIKRDLDGNYVEDFYSISKAAKSIGVTIKAVRSCLIGDSKTSGGYKWEYGDS